MDFHGFRRHVFSTLTNKTNGIICYYLIHRRLSTEPEIYDEVYSPHRQHGQYRQTDRLTDRYKYSKTDTMKTKLKEKIKY